MLEQIRVKQLEDKALVLSEVNVLDHSYDVVFVGGVLVHEELEQLALLLGELMVDLRVSVDLDGDFAAGHMVNRGDDLSKAALSKHFDNLEAVKNLVFGLQNVISFLIVFICDSC